MKTDFALAAKRILAFLLAALLLTACGAKDGFSATGEPETTDPDFVRTPPPVLLAEYVGANQEARQDAGRTGLIDMTNVSKGYIAAQCTADVNARIRIVKGDESAGEIDDYTLDTGGAYNFFPITRGDGSYTFILYIFAGDTPQGPSYERFLVAGTSVALESEFAPFLVPSRIVSYDESSACVQQSYEITKSCQTDLEVVQQVYSWIAGNIKYDTAKAEALGGGGVSYDPDPDETLRSRSGICYDYASLAAAMLRANGIPTKLIKGDVLNGDGGSVYHAWNMVYLEESGWVAVELSVNQNDWTRIDTTFASAGSGMGSFIGDGENYTDLSVH